MKISNKAVIDLGVPKEIPWSWNLGSILGVSFVLQMVSGLLVAFHYVNSTSEAFSSVVIMSESMTFGWFLRILHANGATMLFILLYLHIGRGLYFNSFMSARTWSVGVLLFLLMMATAFVGYVLPWGQMSFWGASVITGLFSAIPLVGQSITEWLWGGFSVGGPTLTRFFSFHFLLPFVSIFFIMVHIISLHSSGSSSPLGITLGKEKVSFDSNSFAKDGALLFVIFSGLISVVLFFPTVFGDPLNSVPANSMVTPIHIQPEWYYLFAYAILRSAPTKLGGVVLLFASVLILFILPWLNSSSSLGYTPNFVIKGIFVLFSITMLFLSYVGAMPVEQPYVEVGQVLSILYFSYFILTPVLSESIKV